MARDNMALPTCSAQSNIPEACSLPLRAMHIAPFLGTQQVYVAIKQAVTLCLQKTFKCSIAEPESKPFVLANQEP